MGAISASETGQGVSVTGCDRHFENLILNKYIKSKLIKMLSHPVTPLYIALLWAKTPANGCEPPQVDALDAVRWVIGAHKNDIVIHCVN